MTAITSECPPPPFYWELGEDLQPPQLSADTEVDVKDAISAREYGGLVRILKRKRTYDVSKDYKAELNTCLGTLLQRSLAIASTVPTNQQQGGVEQHEVLVQLNETLVELHSLLGEFRAQEAREVNLQSLREELLRLLEFERKLESVQSESA